ncbi:MAG TPA: dTDP-4-dehydrorhamnose reductase [Rikenellaceae bacterium]|nr:dTDP-4-dehydrorhamnose reductase [Rikenellaceae bacterium]
MANILITGSKGQLGSELRELLIADKIHNYHFTDLPQLDITNENDVEKYLDINKIEVIINCAAYTSVDKAEDEPKTATLVNGTAPGILARHAAKRGISLIHISTDYVFDGKASLPYKEDHPTEPFSAYGRSKLEGEREIIDAGGEYIIIRTSWLYSAFGSNFAKTILRLSSERESIDVVFDQVGTPTYATDLAKVIIQLLSRKFNRESGQNLITGVYHYSNEGVCSWYDFANEIVKLSGNTCRVNPVTSEKFPTKALRPQYSVLDKGKIKSHMGIEIPHWKESLKVLFLKIYDNE